MITNIQVKLVGDGFRQDVIQTAVNKIFSNWLKSDSCLFAGAAEFSCLTTNDETIAVEAERTNQVVVLISPLRPKVALSSHTIVVDNAQRFAESVRAGLKNLVHKTRKK